MAFGAYFHNKWFFWILQQIEAQDVLPIVMEMIDASNLIKTFGDTIAVNNVSLKVSKGNIVGFLGPNGAGKSTTMRILTGFLKADSGFANICGFDTYINRLAAQSCLGYLPEAVSGFSHLTGREFLMFCCSSRGIKGKNRSIAINRAIKLIDLGFVIDKKIIEKTLGKPK